MILLSPRFSLLWLLYGLAQGEVVPSFLQTCGQFFANPGGGRTSPTVIAGPSYEQICQVRQNVYEFASLYDTANKIPVYSAYEFVGHATCGRKSTWFIEPQLDNPTLPKDMSTEGSVPPQVRGNNQALNTDYDGSGYDRGHLCPVYHRDTQSCADSTFTLTNAAPQDPSFNRGQWKKLEKRVATFLIQNCLPNTAFIVTGVVPSRGATAKFINNRVNVPSHFWSAYCCLDNNLRPLWSQGYLGVNSNKIPAKGFHLWALVNHNHLELVSATMANSPVAFFSCLGSKPIFCKKWHTDVAGKPQRPTSM
ncbi:endonuclease domain-containing 1 protein-like [Chanos chanos]|uniref:Endonuclease domain-containing 1 protein-like n=1 Tax=Chanos chanos TaxID=29144 RepID=A0A6J2VSZ9_CHACN|nr:endonuclease domain-containing 1 protein-like [Chanos chanos]